jgi:hypothetical protein
MLPVVAYQIAGEPQAADKSFGTPFPRNNENPLRKPVAISTLILG